MFRFYVKYRGSNNLVSLAGIYYSNMSLYQQGFEALTLLKGDTGTKAPDWKTLPPCCGCARNKLRAYLSP